VRVEREGALGALAATLAPNQPIGDPQILSAGEAAPASRRGGALRRLFLVGVLAVLVTLGSGPAVNLLGTILGGADGDAAASLSPSPDLTPGASESATPSPSTTPSASPESPSPSPSASPSASAGSGKTYVVQRGDTLYQIGIDLNIKGGYKALAALNGISGPGYTIVPGQILKLP
jgi:nucleoid-associated protein YgaU